MTRHHVDMCVDDFILLHTEVKLMFRYLTLLRGITVVAAAAILLLTGCSKVSQRNFEKIETGMTYDEVKALIGAPTSCETLFTMQQCVWEDGKKKIDIKLLNDQVVMFSSNNL